MPKVGLDCNELKKLIREVPDFPKKGILFYDITTLLKDKAGFATLIDLFSENYIGQHVDLVLGMEARGFIFGPALAYRLNAGFVPVRKAGKLWHDTPLARIHFFSLASLKASMMRFHSSVQWSLTMQWMSMLST